jgi:hypothetical protein
MLDLYEEDKLIFISLVAFHHFKIILSVDFWK